MQRWQMLLPNRLNLFDGNVVGATGRRGVGVRRNAPYLAALRQSKAVFIYTIMQVVLKKSTTCDMMVFLVLCWGEEGRGGGVGVGVGLNRGSSGRYLFIFLCRRTAGRSRVTARTAMSQNELVPPLLQLLNSKKI